MIVVEDVLAVDLSLEVQGRVREPGYTTQVVML
jgi:hypothetical protein